MGEAFSLALKMGALVAVIWLAVTYGVWVAVGAVVLYFFALLILIEDA